MLAVGKNHLCERSTMQQEESSNIVIQTFGELAREQSEIIAQEHVE